MYSKRASITTALKILFGIVMASLALNAQANTDRLQNILATKEMRVCIWPDYYSISYRDPRSQTLSGPPRTIHANHQKRWPTA